MNETGVTKGGKGFNHHLKGKGFRTGGEDTSKFFYCQIMEAGWHCRKIKSLPVRRREKMRGKGWKRGQGKKIARKQLD